MKEITCYLTQNAAWNESGKLTPKRVVWHSTGANNVYLKRYVQPAKDDPNYDILMKQLGKNIYNNDWNHYYVDPILKRKACVHGFIGKLDNGELAFCNTFPENKRAWGVGQGMYGSWNSDSLQFEICEDNLKNKDYANAVIEMAIEKTVEWCRKYNIPASMVMDHNEARIAGYGCPHYDTSHWFPDLLKINMNTIRDRIETKLKEDEPMTKEERAEFDKLVAKVDALEADKAAKDAKIKALEKNQDKIYVKKKDIPSWGKELVDRYTAHGSIKGEGSETLNLRESTLKSLVIKEREEEYALEAKKAATQK